MQARKASGSVIGGVEDLGKERAEMARPVESPQNKCRSLQQNLCKALQRLHDPMLERIIIAVDRYDLHQSIRRCLAGGLDTSAVLIASSRRRLLVHDIRRPSQLLDRHRFREATMPHDKILALLGMSSDIVGPTILDAEMDQ